VPRRVEDNGTKLFWEVAVVTNQPYRALDGVWRNQLGTVIRLRTSSGDRLEGWLESNVGGAVGAHPLIGFFQPGDQGVVLGFVVAFEETRSVTSWNGRYGAIEGTISAVWILSEQSEVANEWQATRIGYDTFVRETDAAVGVSLEQGADRTGGPSEDRVA
jgi:hypothetical protein